MRNPSATPYPYFLPDDCPFGGGGGGVEGFGFSPPFLTSPSFILVVSFFVSAMITPLH
jgi:hypothetical protein